MAKIQNEEDGFLQQTKGKSRNKYLDGLMIALGLLVLIELIVMCLYQPMKSNDFSIVQCQKMENTFTVRWEIRALRQTLPV